MIIIYRKMKRKQAGRGRLKNNFQVLINRQIYKGQFYVNYKGNMADQTKQWWEGLGKELQTDIETLDESS